MRPTYAASAALLATALAAPPSSASPDVPKTNGPEGPTTNGAAEERPRWGDRTLAGHTFPIPSFVDSPFVITTFGFTARVISLHTADLPTDFGNLSVKATTVANDIDLGFKLSDKVGLTFAGSGRALVGTDTPSLVYLGANWNYGGGLGGVVRIARIEETGTQISLRLSLAYSSGQVAAFIPAFGSASATVVLGNLIQGNLGSALITPAKTFTYGGSVTAAQALSPVVGLQGFVGLGGSSLTLSPFNLSTGTRDDQTTGGFNFRFGGAVSADFDPEGFPLALLGEYALSHRPSTLDVLSSAELDTVHTFAAGALYSGRQDLQLGLQGALQLGLAPLENRNGISERPHAYQAELLTRYIW